MFAHLIYLFQWIVYRLLFTGANPAPEQHENGEGRAVYYVTSYDGENLGSLDMLSEMDAEVVYVDPKTGFTLYRVIVATTTSQYEDLDYSQIEWLREVCEIEIVKHFVQAWSSAQGRWVSQDEWCEEQSPLPGRDALLEQVPFVASVDPDWQAQNL